MNAPVFSHVINNQPGMVDVGHKPSSMRIACAQAEISMPTEITAQLVDNEVHTPKGPVFHTAIIAATMAVKKTSDLIPFCHTLNVENIKITINVAAPGKIVVQAMVKTFSKTGVEMEALMGASIAALTIYDMCKSFSFAMEIGGIKLLEKSGGKHDFVAQAKRAGFGGR
jgi:cyclic pyranopterin monophosphate synthase